MRRGLIAWSKTELPEAVLASRVERTQAAMAKAGLAALLCYSNNTRPAAASWLSGFVPYWSEAMLVLPRSGQPYLVAALSKRVTTWIMATSRFEQVISAPRLGVGAGRAIAEAGGGTVGVADLDALPAGIAEDLRGAGAALADAGDMFAALRGKADPAELALAMHAGEIARLALGRASPRDAQAPAMIAAVEGAAREAAAEECYVAVAPDLARDRRLVRIEGEAALGPSFAIRATVAYKGVWVRATRTVFRDRARAKQLQHASELFAAAVASLPRGDGFASCSDWLVEGCRIAQPLEPLMGRRMETPRALTPGALVSVQACIAVDGTPILLGASALTGAAGEPAALLIPPHFGEGD